MTDICLLTEGQSPKTLKAASLSQNFGLELIESILVNHDDTVMSQPEQIHVIRVGLMPVIVKIVSERANFSGTVRAMRLLQLITSRLLFALAPECEIALSLVNHMLDPDAAVLWKRALCLEFFRGIHAEAALIRSIYSHYDEQEGKRNIIRDHLATLVRLASENPTIIGLGHQSSTATSTPKIGQDSREQPAGKATGIIGSIEAAVSMSDPNSPGISIQRSTVRTACIDQLDKSEAPALPMAYIYGLTLTCINTFSEGLARFLLPFTAPNEAKPKRKLRVSQGRESSSNVEVNVSETSLATGKGKDLTRNRSFRSRKTPINPLSLEDHILYNQICTSGHIVDNCWPALLAACSTFLNATLDSDYYHALIRSFQKFTQVAGLLDMATPRDAFLTTLGKHAVPSTSLITPTLETQSSASVLNGHNDSQIEEGVESSREPSPAPSSSSDRPRQSLDRGHFRLTTRHLLCLRALLNLGIALGPVLGQSWSIILEILQQADLIISRSRGIRRPADGRHSRQPSDDQTAGSVASVPGDIGLEITAAETAASRMIESTVDLSNKAFLDILNCLCNLLRNIEILNEQFPQPVLTKHRRIATAVGKSMDGTMNDRANIFVLEKLGDLIQCNLSRLVEEQTAETGWNLLVAVCIPLLSSPTMSFDVRIHAARTLNNLALSIATIQDPTPSEERDSVRRRGLDALLKEVGSIRNERPESTRVSQSCETEIHRLALETLRAVLEQCGDSLHVGWDCVFAILTSIFNKPASSGDAESLEHSELHTMSPKLVRSSFSSLQLICSDFLDSIPRSCLPILLETLYSFCTQEQDLNISLTASGPMSSTRDESVLTFYSFRQPLFSAMFRISSSATTKVSHLSTQLWNVNRGSISWILSMHKTMTYPSQLCGSACLFI